MFNKLLFDPLNQIMKMNEYLFDKKNVKNDN